MKKLKFAVIGVSIHGRRHVEGIISNKDSELVAICDTDEKTLNDVGNIYGIENRVKDYRELLDKNLIDAVCIITPDQVHEEMVVAFLNKGIHVL